MARQAPNPYASPATRSGPGREPRSSSGRGPDWASEQRGVVIVLLLSVITIGFYVPIWYLRRQRFLDGIAPQKLGQALPVLLILTTVIGNVAPFALETSDLRPLANVFVLGAAIVSLVVRFRVQNILQAAIRAEGLPLEVNGAATFFLGIPYLQWVINRAAEASERARVERRERRERKRRKKMREAASD